MNRLLQTKNHLQLVYQFITFKTGLLISEILVWSFYYITLYQITGKLYVLMIDAVLWFAGIWIGFLIATMYVDKIGYLLTYRISFIAQAAVFIFVTLSLNEIAVIYPIIALIRGISRGFAFAPHHSIGLREIQGNERSSTILLSGSIDQVLSIILPVLAGSLLTVTNDFRSLTLLCIAVYIVLIFAPFRYNKQPRTKLRFSEISKILRKKYIKRFVFLHLIISIESTLFFALFLIIPYLLIQNEFQVGVLLGFIGLFAAAAGLYERVLEDKSRVLNGYWVSIIYSALTAALALVWSIPLLVARSIALAFNKTLVDTVKADCDYKIRENLLAEDSTESGLEMNVLIETTYLVGRVTGFMFLVVLLVTFEGNEEAVVRAFLLIAAPFSIITYTALNFLKRIKP